VAPSGWTISGAVAMAQLQGDPHTIAVPSAKVVTGATPFTSAVFTGLTPGVYQVAAWLIWTKPDLTLAYSPSLNTTFTAT
jgi:hypothetical protein